MSRLALSQVWFWFLICCIKGMHETFTRHLSILWGYGGVVWELLNEVRAYTCKLWRSHTVGCLLDSWALLAGMCTHDSCSKWLHRYVFNVLSTTKQLVLILCICFVDFGNKYIGGGLAWFKHANLPPATVAFACFEQTRMHLGNRRSDRKILSTL